MLRIVILADAEILTVTLFFLCGGTLHIWSNVVPSSTSLLPLSIQRGRQWFNLFHWRRLLPFIKLPLDFFFQIVANLEKRKEIMLEVMLLCTKETNMHACRNYCNRSAIILIVAINFNTSDAKEVFEQTFKKKKSDLFVFLFPDVVLMHWCVIQSPCHLDSHGNYRHGSLECTLQPPDGLPSSWGPGDTSGRMQVLATLWTKTHYIMCLVYLRTGGRDCTTSQW